MIASQKFEDERETKDDVHAETTAIFITGRVTGCRSTRSQAVSISDISSQS